MKRFIFALSLSLVACQSGNLHSGQPQPSQVVFATAPVTQQVSAEKILLPVARDLYKPEPQAQIKRQGNQVQLNMPLPALPGFKTQALDFGAATKITVTLSDSNGNVYQPVGADGNGQVAYPPSGNLNLDFNNVYPDRLIIAELKVHDAVAVIPQADLALAFAHLSTSNANVVMNFSTTPAGKAMKALLGANAVRARAINLTDLHTLSNAITGRSGTAPNYAYTTHPALVNTGLLATDLAAQDPGALTAANYRLNGATVNATVSGLVASDALELQVTDAASAIKTNAGNGLQAILKAAAGTGLNILARSSGTPGTSYTYTLTPSNLSLTEGGTQAVAVTATPATPTVTSLSTSTGSIGNSITITGTNFHTAMAGNLVKFGTTTATVTAATATSLTVTVPAGISGTQNVTVSVGTQTNSGTHNFAVTPAITSLSPTAGAIGNSITLNGTGFDTTPANNTVKFGATTATVTAATATTLTVTVPVGITGTQDVSVQVGAQTSANTAADNFTVTPGITSLSTSFGAIGNSITINGTGFDTTPANNTVKFGTTAATVTAATATTLTVTVPAGISGAQNVTVQVGAQTNTGTNNFNVTPTIASLSAGNGAFNDSITLTGTGFNTTLANNTVKFGVTSATVTAATATTLTVTVPNAPSGGQNVTVQVGTQTSMASAFTVNPKITGLSTAFGTVLGKAVLIRDEILTISGSGFDLTTAANNQVSFGATNVAASAVNGSNLEVRVPIALSTGDVNVSVTVNTLTTNAVTANLPVTSVNISGGLH